MDGERNLRDSPMRNPVQPAKRTIDLWGLLGVDWGDKFLLGSESAVV